ncbi:transcription elongation factor GreB [bacterium]|nr:transcription elongation factor GreB [bacterium]
MSKAFTKENDDAEDLSLEEAQENQQVSTPGGKNYITPHGIERLRSEWKKLMDVDRPEIVKVIQWAAGNGDRSENGDYIYGKRKLREIDRRIRFLTKRMENAEVIDPTKQSSEKVLFGATVTILDEAGLERKYSIVGIDETDGKRGRISWISPIAKALLQKKVGDTVTVRLPKGDEDFEIVKVEYLEIVD